MSGRRPTSARVNLQILHCGGTHGHTANTGGGTPPGYAMGMAPQRRHPAACPAGARAPARMNLPHRAIQSATVIEVSSDGSCAVIVSWETRPAARR